MDMNELVNFKKIDIIKEMIKKKNKVLKVKLIMVIQYLAILQWIIFMTI